MFSQRYLSFDLSAIMLSIIIPILAIYGILLAIKCVYVCEVLMKQMWEDPRVLKFICEQECTVYFRFETVGEKTRQEKNRRKFESGPSKRNLDQT